LLAHGVFTGTELIGAQTVNQRVTGLQTTLRTTFDPSYLDVAGGA
jgi:hypothetical protein